MSAIYIHIPFCKRLCGYCDFFKSVKLQHKDATLDAMRRELVEERNFLNDKKIETIYFGGGTPSLIDADTIANFMRLISENYDCSALGEVTLEANPDDLSLEYLQGLRKAGINRLSVGIQSFDDTELKFMNRRHTSQQAIRAIKDAQSVGFDNITIDLIFGVYGFGEDVLRRSIKQALALKVQHISAYHLTIEPGTLFARRVAKGEFRAVDEQVSEREYAIMETMLCDAGYEHYEVSNYALPTFRSRHNSSYWHGVHYLGIGPGAHSFNGDSRRWVNSSIEEYIKGGNERYESELLSDKEQYDEYVMTALRCAEGLDLEQLRRRFSDELYLYIIGASKSWIESGHLINEDGRLYIPTSHFLVSDSIIESLFAE